MEARAGVGFLELEITGGYYPQGVGTGNQTQA